MIRSAPYLTAALLASTLGLACGVPAEPQTGVLWRAGEHSPADPALTASSRKLGTRTRNALSTGRVEISVPAGSQRLDWSLACPSEENLRGTGRVRIEAHRSGSWETIAETSVRHDAGWQDHSVQLAEGVAKLRVSADAEGSCEPLIGSPVLLGHTTTAPRANVVLVSLDTLGAASVGAFSGARDVSPRLDAFLASSASFRRAYAQYGNTLVSHSSLFSGLYPRRHGVYTDVVPGPLVASLVGHFARAGYRTVAFTEGAFVSAAFGFAFGFDAYDDGAIGLAEQMAGGAPETFDRAADWIEERDTNSPFLLFVHSYEVHSPYLPRDDASAAVASRHSPGDDRVFPRELQGLSLIRHNDGSAPLPPQDLRRLEALHLGEVHDLDAALGRFLARLEAAGHADDTIVVITSDHGDQFGEAGKVGHGDSLHNRVLHVPLAFRGPGVTTKAAIDAPVQLVDVLPTLLELVSLPVPHDLDGRSLAPLLTGGTLPDRPAFSEQRTARGECSRLEAPAGCRLDRIAVQEDHFKLVDSRWPAWTRLYDLREDAAERQDVAERHPEVRDRLLAQVRAYRQGPAPESADAQGGLDAETVQRLRDLGYAVPGDAGTD